MRNVLSGVSNSDKMGRFRQIVTLLKLLYLYDARNIHVDIHMVYGHTNGLPWFVNRPDYSGKS